MSIPKPETVGQAAAWDLVRAQARRFGLCDRCSAQVAWAVQQHSGGFAAAHSPCEPCRLLMKWLPVERANGWRTVKGAAADARNWPLHLTDEIPATAPVQSATVERESRILRRPAHVDERLREGDG